MHGIAGRLRGELPTSPSAWRADSARWRRSSATCRGRHGETAARGRRRSSPGELRQSACRRMSALWAPSIIRRVLRRWSCGPNRRIMLYFSRPAAIPGHGFGATARPTRAQESTLGKRYDCPGRRRAGKLPDRLAHASARARSANSAAGTAADAGRESHVVLSYVGRLG